jgi:putative ABC transport system permease protein
MTLLATVLQDFRYATRVLVLNAGLTAVLILALALGIGVNTAVFTAYKVFVARPLDARDPNTLVNFSLRLQSGGTNARFSYPDYEAYRDHLQSFSGLIAFSIEQLVLTDAGGAARPAQSASLMKRLGLLNPSVSNAEQASTFVVSENYFSVLGVPPVRGRAFDAISASELAATPSVLISENYWQRRFASDPLVLGKTVRLNGAAFSIIGITPMDFTGTSIAVPNFWFPLRLYPLVHPSSTRLTDRDDLCCRVWGRLRAGVSMSEAQAESTVLAAQLRGLHGPKSDLRDTAGAVISPGSPLPGVNAALRLSIALIMGAAGLVLVIACANAAGLQLARATARQHELGVRLSLGASPSRLIRQLVTESLLLGLLAGSLALPVTSTILHLAVTRAAEVLPSEYTFILDVRPDLGVFAYVLAISLLAGILFGLAPAVVASRSALVSITRGAGASLVRGRLRYWLIAAQVAVSLTLLICGGLLVHSASQALRMDTGYEVKQVIDVSLQFPEGRSYTAEQRAAVVRNLRSRLTAIPGVTALTSARAPNDHLGRRADVSVNGEEPSAQNMRGTLYYTWIQPNYFETLGIPLSRGRGFQIQAGQPDRVAILSESAARRLWPGEDVIGREVRLGTNRQFHERGELLPDGQTWQVIGVVRDTRGVTLDGSDSQQVFLPLPEDRLQSYPILVRVQSNPILVMRAMEPAIAAADPDLIATVSTLQAMLRQTEAFLAASLSAAIATSISVFGVLLAAMGIFSAVNYDVILRTREVGIRMAIGAQQRDVLWLMMWQSLRPVCAGLLAGIVLAMGASRLLRGVLYGLGGLDIVSFAAASGLFLTVALFASWWPSRRAMHIDPLVALREQ